MTINAKAMLLPIGILIAGGLAMWILLSFRSEPERRKPAPRQKIVESEVIELKDVPSEINAYGRLTSAQPVVLYSEVPGTLMEGNVSFQPGQSFRNGDLLIRVDGRQARLDLNSAKSDLLTALASVLPEIKVDFPEQFQVWQDYFNRIEFGTTIPRLPEVKDQKIKLFLSRFNVYKLYFSVRNLEIRLEKHAIYAPFDGAIVSAELRPGSTVRNGSRLGEIINLENLEMRVPVQVQDIRWIDQRKPVQITSKEIGDQWSGRIERIGKAIDPQTQTVEVYITVRHNQNDHLYEGVFLEADIPGLKIDGAVAIPRKSLYEDSFVYLIKDGRLEYRKVKIARRENSSVIVTGGIESGDTLVTEIMQGVAPGMPAKAILAEEEGGS